MGAVGIFIFGTILAVISSGRWLLGGEMDIIQTLASFNMAGVQTAGVWTVPKTLGTYWDAIFTALSWNYPFLDYSWAIFVKIPLWIVSIGVIWGFIEVAMTVVQGLVSTIRGILP
jgi:hypothetical protein